MMNKYKAAGTLLFALLFLGTDIFAQLPSFTWSPAGPVLSAGRSRNMIVDKFNGKHLFVGSPTSGIFESSDGGANWAPLDDQGTVRNISYLAQDVNGLLYASTGEGFLRFTARQKAAPGTGVYKLDASNNMILVVDSAVVGTVITRIACHPQNASRMAVAGNKGLFITEDGGATFIKAAGAIVPTATALTVSYDVDGAIYTTATSVNTGGGVRVFKSASGAVGDFVDITPVSDLLPNSNYGRIELAIANSNKSTIYASIARPTNPNSTLASAASMFGFFVSKNGGQTWTLILEASPQLDPLSNGASINSGDYSHSVLVNPFNDNQVFVGGYKFYVWTKDASGPEGVGNWVRFGNEFLFGTPIYLRHNIHDIRVSTSGSSITAYYFVTDAGVYKSSDNLLSFQPFFKGLGTAQYNSISIYKYPKTTKSGNALEPYSAYLSATDGNGLSFYSGNYPSVSNELNYLSGDLINAQLSNFSHNTAFVANTSSQMFLASDILNNQPGSLLASHLGSRCNQEPSIAQIDFRGISNGGSTTDGLYSNNSYSVIGTPFKLWENVGAKAPVDSAFFYNDTVRVQIAVTNSLETAYAVSLVKPQPGAILDKVIIRTYTVGVPSAQSGTCFIYPNESYTNTALQKAAMEFIGATSSTATPSSIVLSGLTSSTVNATNNYSVNVNDMRDVVLFELPNNPVAALTATANYQFVRVGVTCFYRYNAGTSIHVENENISSLKFMKDSVLSTPISWSFNSAGTTSIVPVSTGAPIKFKMPYSSRLAVLNDKGLLISKRSLNTNDPQKFQMVSCTGALTTNSSTYTAGQMTVTGLPYLLDWAPDGKSVYYVTSVTTGTPTYRIYKVNVSASMHDFGIEDYRGLFYTGCVNGTRNTATLFTFTTNFNSPYRTTLIGTFTERITNLAVSDNSKTLLVTTADKSSGGKRIYTSTPNIDDSNIDNTVVTFSDKTGNLPELRINCALFLKNNNNHVLVGTEAGVFGTSDITSSTPNWQSMNNNQLPRVQITDLKQQKMDRWDCYNSGVIYVATNGRGAWINKQFLDMTVIGVSENELIARNTGLSVFPNPSNGMVNLNFYSAYNENVTVYVMDMNGRIVKSESMNKLQEGYTDYKFDSSDLSSGVYIINVSSSLGIKRNAKLIVTK